MANNTGLVLMVVTVVSNMAYGASTFLVSRPESGYTTLWEGWVQPIATVLPAIIAIVRAVRTPSQRLPWALVAAALLANTVGTCVLAFHDANLDPAPSPLVSDYFFLSAGIILAIASVAMSQGGVHQATRADHLDSLVMGLAVGCIATALWFQPLLHAYGLTAESLVGVGYPLMDIALLMAVASAILPTRRAPSLAVILFLVGTLSWAAGDIIYMRQLAAGTYELGTPLELLWSAGTALFGIATAFPSERPSSRTPQPANDTLIPVVFAMFTLVVVVLGLAGSVPSYVAYLGVITVALLLARTSFTARDLRRAHDAHREARFDDLTSILNRRGFFEAIDAAFEHPTMPWSLAMIDLDGFKAINDRLGHHAGDSLLAAVGNRLRDSLPTGGFVGRLGGDEFAVALPGIQEHAKINVEAMLRALNQDLHIEPHTISVEASAGIASWPVDGFSAHAVLRCADAALYSAKKGDERVEVFSSLQTERTALSELGLA